jgi:hypothetical protein
VAAAAVGAGYGGWGELPDTSLPGGEPSPKLASSRRRAAAMRVSVRIPAARRSPSSWAVVTRSAPANSSSVRTGPKDGGWIVSKRFSHPAYETGRSVIDEAELLASSDLASQIPPNSHLAASGIECESGY